MKENKPGKKKTEKKNFFQAGKREFRLLVI